MRLIASLTLVLALIIALGLWINHSLVVTCNELTKNIDQIITLVENEDWQQAETEVAVLDKLWQKKAGWWPVVLEHQEIDNIDFALARLKQYVANKDSTLTQSLLSELKVMVKHIPEKEAVNLENIL